MKDEHVVIDAATVVDLMVATDVGPLLDQRLEGCHLHAPSHIDAEVVGGFDRLERAGVLSQYRAEDLVRDLAVAPIERHSLAPLLEGAWRYRDELPMGDALYVELARSLGLALVTTNPTLTRVAHSVADFVAPAGSGPRAERQ